jgi:hypothetical protein
MDRARHPFVVRTWTVERTKVPYRPPQAAKPLSDRQPGKPAKTMARPQRGG